MLIAYILYGNHSLKKILKLDDKLERKFEMVEVNEKSDKAPQPKTLVPYFL